MVRPDGVDEVRAIVRPASGAHIGFSPIAPLDGSEAQRQSRMVRDRAAEYGFEYNGSFFFAPRYLSHVYMIAFDRDDWDEAQRAQELVEVLVRDGAAEGYGEYRAHVDFMDLIAEQYDFNDGAMGRFNARIKGALDPQGILSPGKQGIWPAVVAVRQRLDGAGGRARAVRRVLVAGEFRHTSPWSVILALDGLAAPCTTLTVAVVAEHPGCSGLLIAYSTRAVRRAAPRSGAGGLRSRVQAGRPGAARCPRGAPRHGRMARARAARLRAALRRGPRRRAAEPVARPPAGPPRGLEGLRLETHSNV